MLSFCFIADRGVFSWCWASVTANCPQEDVVFLVIMYRCCCLKLILKTQTKLFWFFLSVCVDRALQIRQSNDHFHYHEQIPWNTGRRSTLRRSRSTIIIQVLLRLLLPRSERHLPPCTVNAGNAASLTSRRYHLSWRIMAHPLFLFHPPGQRLTPTGSDVSASVSRRPLLTRATRIM